MTNEQILVKAVEKAAKNGFKELSDFNEANESTKLKAIQSYSPDYYKLIFSHDFAKAFWGHDNVKVLDKMGLKDIKIKNTKLTLYTPRWAHYLRETVVKRDPIKYLEKFL